MKKLLLPLISILTVSQALAASDATTTGLKQSGAALGSTMVLLAAIFLLIVTFGCFSVMGFAIFKGMMNPSPDCAAIGQSMFMPVVIYFGGWALAVGASPQGIGVFVKGGFNQMSQWVTPTTQGADASFTQ